MLGERQKSRQVLLCEIFFLVPIVLRGREPLSVVFSAQDPFAKRGVGNDTNKLLETERAPIRIDAPVCEAVREFVCDHLAMVERVSQ